MSWLKLDDSFPDHPKLLELARADRWRWVELLALVARYRTGGHVTPGMLRAADIPTRLRAQLVAVGLLDVDQEHELHVHDWSVYNPPADPTNAERQARWRAKRRAQLDAENRSEAERDTPPAAEHVEPMNKGLEHDRNALPVTVEALPPVPVPVTPTHPKPSHTPSTPVAPAGGRVGDAVAEELERLRLLSGGTPTWPDGDASS